MQRNERLIIKYWLVHLALTLLSLRNSGYEYTVACALCTDVCTAVLLVCVCAGLEVSRCGMQCLYVWWKLNTAGLLSSNVYFVHLWRVWLLIGKQLTLSCMLFVQFSSLQLTISNCSSSKTATTHIVPKNWAAALMIKTPKMASLLQCLFQQAETKNFAKPQPNVHDLL